MELQTQNFLKTLDVYKNDNGVTFKELKLLDKNNDGKISGDETKASTISNRDLVLINQKYKTYNTLINKHIPFVTEDIVLYTTAELNTELFPGGVQGISTDDVQQGGVGDCYFLSALAGLAKQRPQDIVDMIKDNRNGTYTVKLKGGKVSVTVDKPTNPELNRYASRGPNNSIWVAVIEKAYAKYLNNNAGEYDKIIKAGIKGSMGLSGLLLSDYIDKISILQKKVPQEKIIGQFISTGINLVTGKSTDTDMLMVTSNSTIREKLKKALNNDKIVILSATKWFGGSKEKKIPDAHVYTVLSYDPKTDTVRVRNPWGIGSDAKELKYPDNINDGEFTVTMDELNKYFSFICYEQ